MFYLIKNGIIEGSSNSDIKKEGYETIEKDFSQEELKKIENGYKYNIENGTFEETEKSINNKNLEIENQKQSLLLNLGQLKQKFDGMVLLGEDTTEIEAEIETIKNLYFNL